MSASMAAAGLSRNGGSGSGGGALGISRPQPSSWLVDNNNNKNNYNIDGMTAATPSAAASVSATAMAIPAIAHNNTTDSAAKETLVLRGLPASTEWETYKAIIHELYMDRNLNLDEVVERMRVHDFHATARMYKTQFARWGWSKYNCKRLRRDISTGKAVVKAQGKSCHRVKRKRVKKTNGSKVPPSPSTSSSSAASSSSPSRTSDNTGLVTPPTHYDEEEASLSSPESNVIAVTTNTPPDQQLVVLQSYSSYHHPQLILPAHIAHVNDTNRFMQSILTDIRNHVYEVFSHKPSWHQSRTTRIGLINAYEYTSYDQFVLALDAFLQRANVDGGEILRQAFVDVEAAIQRDYSATFYFLFVDLPDLLLHYNRHDILTILLGHLKRLTSPGAMRLKERISGTGLAALHALAETDPAALQHYIPTASGLWCDLLAELRGPRDRSTLLAKRNYLRHDRGMDQRYRVSQLCEDYDELLGGVVQQFGPGHTMSHHMEDVVLSTQLVHDYFVEGFVEQNEGLIASLENKYRLVQPGRRPPPLYGTTAGGGGVREVSNPVSSSSTTTITTTARPMPPSSSSSSLPHPLLAEQQQPPVTTHSIPVEEWDVLDRHIRSNCFSRLAYYYKTASSRPCPPASSPSSFTSIYTDNTAVHNNIHNHKNINTAAINNNNRNLALATYYDNKSREGWHTHFWQLEAETTLVAAGRNFEAQSLRRCRLEAQYVGKLPENDRARIAWVGQAGGRDDYKVERVLTKWEIS